MLTEKSNPADKGAQQQLAQRKAVAPARAGRRGRLLHVPTPGPVKAFLRARRAAENLPLAGRAFERWRRTEDWAMAELKFRLDTIGESAARVVDDAGRFGRATRRLGELLETGRYTDAEEAKERMYMQVLGQLLPEQARMLAALTKKEFTAMCHVDAGSAPVGPGSRRVLAYASTAGRDAGLILRDSVPRLMAGMVVLGLVEEMPEQKQLKTQYEILQSDDSVRRAIEHVKDDLHMWPRVHRRSLRLSRFGSALWEDVGSRIKSGHMRRSSEPEKQD